MIINHELKTLKEFAVQYLMVYNLSVSNTLRLTPKEIQLLSEFVTLPSKYEYYRLSVHGKRQVVKSLSEQKIPSNILSINLKLQSLVKKNFIKRDEDKVLYLPEHFLKALDLFKKNKTFNIQIKYVDNSNSEST